MKPANRVGGILRYHLCLGFACMGVLPCLLAAYLFWKLGIRLDLSDAFLFLAGLGVAGLGFFFVRRSLCGVETAAEGALAEAGIAPPTGAGGPADADALARSITVLAGKLRLHAQGLEENARALAQKDQELAARSEDLRRMKDFLGQVVENISEGIVVVDAARRVVLFNRAAGRILGHSPAEVVGLDCALIFPSYGTDPVEETFRSGRGVPHRVGRFYARDRSRVSADWTSFLISGDDGPRVVLVLKDMAEAEAFQERLVESARMSAVGRLASGIAGGLRGPLTSIVGFSQYLQGVRAGHAARPGSRPRMGLEEGLARIEREAARANRTLDRLLAFADRPPQPRRPTDVVRALRAAWADLQAAEDCSAISVVWDVPQPGPEVLASESELREVFGDLLGNAAQAMAGGGALRISARLEDGNAPGRQEVVIRLRDTGPGVPRELIAQVFEPFFTTRSDRGCAGLGLAIAREIVRDLGGTISLTSEQGDGAVAVVRIPRADSAAFVAAA
jgi:PAS domain S-box-containing protein